VELNASVLDGHSFRDEAFILCLVYIDGLASSYYRTGPGNVGKNFCKALRKLSGNPLFGKLYAPWLLDSKNDKYKHWKQAKTLVQQLVTTRAGKLLDAVEIAQAIRHHAVMPKGDKKSLVGELWHYSVAAICYEVMRNAAVHGLGASPLCFSKTVHDGHEGFELSFSVLHEALQRIGEHVAKTSISKGEWFGRKGFLKSR
jgi:hypothetical protein